MTAQHTGADATALPLGNGDTFPSLRVAAVGGGTISLPSDLAGSYGVVLFYRGSWCPYCNAQLTAFHRASDELTEVGRRWWPSRSMTRRRAPRWSLSTT